VPGAAAKGACVYEHALTWALEAEQLDLPRLSARCERFIAMHREHLHKYALLIDSLSSPARRRVMMGLFHALQSAQKRSTQNQTFKCHSCSGTLYGATGEPLLCTTYPSVEEFMSWRTATSGVS